MDTPPLTRNQQRVYDALRAYIDRHGYAPCVRELMEDAGISSTSVVMYNLRLLEGLGMIRLGPKGASRAIALLPDLRAAARAVVEAWSEDSPALGGAIARLGAAL